MEIEVTIVLTKSYDNWPRIRQRLKSAPFVGVSCARTGLIDWQDRSREFPQRRKVIGSKPPVKELQLGIVNLYMVNGIVSSSMD